MLCKIIKVKTLPAITSLYFLKFTCSKKLQKPIVNNGYTSIIERAPKPPPNHQHHQLQFKYTMVKMINTVAVKNLFLILLLKNKPTSARIINGEYINQPLRKPNTYSIKWGLV